MKLSELKINPDNPQIFDDLSKLENSIKDFPKMMSLRKIVYDPKTMMVLGGNKRLICLQNLKYKEIPDEWVISADELTEDEKKRFVIADNVGFGEWDWDILANDWNQDELIEWGLDLPVWNEETDNQDDKYTTKIDTPIYETKNEKPEISVLFDSEKYKTLINEIEKSSIPEDIKTFLKVSASRHIVFNYENIADYYAHSDKEVQELMENSALVIIDFEKAIELGYVKLREEISNQYLQDYGDE